MATKTFEELKQLAIQIRDEKTNKQNTATRIGTQMLEHLDKLEQDYYDKTATNEELQARDEKLTELEGKVNRVSFSNNILLNQILKEAYIEGDIESILDSSTGNYNIFVFQINKYEEGHYAIGIRNKNSGEGDLLVFSEYYTENPDMYLKSYNEKLNITFYFIIDWSKVNTTNQFNERLNNNIIDLSNSPYIASILNGDEIEKKISKVSIDLSNVKKELSSLFYIPFTKGIFLEEGKRIKESEDFYISDVISVKSGDILHYTGNLVNCTLTIYDANFNILRNIAKNYDNIPEGGTEKEFDITILEGEKYLIASSQNVEPDMYFINSSFYENNPQELSRKILNIREYFSLLSDKITEVDSNTYYPIYAFNFPYGGYYIGDANEIISEGSEDFPMTDYIDITDIKAIEYRLSLGNSAYIILFFNNDKSPLIEISIKGNSGNPSANQGFLNLKEAKEKGAKFFRASNYNGTNGGINDYYVKKCVHVTEAIPNIKGYKSKINICALGDSITEGHRNNYIGWPEYLYDMLGNAENSIKIAHSGAVMRTMADECTKENMKNIDVCIIVGGTNQVAQFSIGSINDMPTPDDIKANTDYLIDDYVLGGPRESNAWHPNIIYNYTVIYQCITQGNTGNITVDDITNMSTNSGETVTLGTAIFKVIGYPSWYSDLWRVTKKIFECKGDIRLMFATPIRIIGDIDKQEKSWNHFDKYQAIRDFCSYNSIQCIDLQHLFNLTRFNKDAIMSDDGTHPIMEGYKLIAKIISTFI